MQTPQMIFDRIFTDKPLESDKLACRIAISDYAIDHDGYILHAVNGALDKLLDTIKPYLNRGIYIQPLKFTAFDDYPSFQRALEVSTRVSQVKEAPVIFKYVDNFAAIPNDHHYCEFCGGHTKNDMRGHCCACGAPRIKVVR